MDGEEAALEVEQVESGEQIEQQESGTEQQSEQQTQQEESPFAPKTAREFSQALKAWKDANPNDPNIVKFARMAKDAFSRQYALNQIDPRGVDGYRELKALHDSVIYNDPERGELKGSEAISALQDSAREIAELDELLAQGDPKALESFGEDFNEGLAKLAPAILDRIQKSNPEAYSAAVLPHFVKALAESPMVQNYNAMVDVLNEQMPSWLPDDRKQAWAADRMNRVMQLAGGMGTWLNAQAEKAGKLPQGQTGKDGKTVERQTQREQEVNKREQDHHWNTNINPKVDQHASVRFTELYRPYANRLKLDAPTTQALKTEFSKRVANMAAKDPSYAAQLKRYFAQSNPDPTTVVNFAKVNFDKHAKTVMDSLVNERYKPFLSGKKPVQQQSGTQQRTSPTSGVTFVSVKPASGDIDYKSTSPDMIYRNQYKLKNGKTVQVRA